MGVKPDFLRTHTLTQENTLIFGFYNISALSFAIFSDPYLGLHVSFRPG